MQIRLLCAVLFTATLASAQTISPQKNANGKWALVDNTGKPVSQPIYKRITATGSVGYIVENAATKLCGLLSYTGNEIIACVYDSICSYHNSDELTAVLKNKKYGFINTKGQLVLVPEFDKISDSNFYKGFVTVKKGSEVFVIDNNGNKLMPSPEPQESNCNRALAAANSTKERTAALTDYINSIGTLGSSDGQKTYWIANKFKQMMDIDYQAYFETMMSKAVKGDDMKRCVKATQSLSKEQIGGLKALAQYTVDEYVATQNNKPAPAYPAGIPRPGYGWGKTSSSDKPGAYGNTGSMSTSQTAAPSVEEVSTRQLIGTHWTTIKDGQLLMVKVISYKRISGTNSFSVTIKTAPADKPGTNYTCHIETEDVYATVFLQPGLGIVYRPHYPAANAYTTCGACKGNGYTMQGGSHTNDYQYTLGSKTTYTWSTKVSCKTCNGNGSISNISRSEQCLNSN